MRLWWALVAGNRKVLIVERDDTKRDQAALVAADALLVDEPVHLELGLFFALDRLMHTKFLFFFGTKPYDELNNFSRMRGLRNARGKPVFNEVLRDE